MREAAGERPPSRLIDALGPRVGETQERGRQRPGRARGGDRGRVGGEVGGRELALREVAQRRKRERVGERLRDQQPQRIAAARVMGLVLDDREQLVGREPRDARRSVTNTAGRRSPAQNATGRGSATIGERVRARPARRSTTGSARSRRATRRRRRSERSARQVDEGLREREQVERDGVAVDRAGARPRDEQRQVEAAARRASRSPRAAARSPRARRARARRGRSPSARSIRLAQAPQRLPPLRVQRLTWRANCTSASSPKSSPAGSPPRPTRAPR